MFPLTRESTEGASEKNRSSLRFEILFNLAFLAAAALVLALWIASLLQQSIALLPYSGWLLVLLVALDLVVFLAFGNHLLNRLVLRPVAGAVAVAEAIARGEYERRVPAGRTREMAVLSTSLNRLTDQLLQNQQRLAENVRSLDETNQRLNETQRELIQAEKLASIGRLAAGVAHEIGNPLGAVLGYSSVLKRRNVFPEIVEGLDREAHRIDRIVRGLLDYARAPAAAPEPVDVNESIRATLELLRDQGKLQDVRIELHLQSTLSPIECVPHRLEQVFVNLFLNAEGAMDGHGEISITTRQERYVPAPKTPARRADDPPGVDYSHLRRPRYGSFRDTWRLQSEREIVRVVIADTGPGIPPEVIDSVFDPFYTTKPPGEGTGLGLAIVASTVAEIGGRIEVSSTAEGGATFSLFLPTIGPET